MRTERELLDILDAQLGFPDYFGVNWDAFDEVIRNLEWLEPYQVVIVHEDIPLVEDRAEAKIYLSILFSAIEHWDMQDNHELIVCFPAECKEQVEQIRTGRKGPSWFRR